MPTTFRNGDLFVLGTGQPNPLDQLIDLAVPARIKLQLVRLAKMLRAEVGLLLETRDKYIRLYGEEDGKGGFNLIPPGNEDKPASANWPKYKAEMEDLMSQTTKLEFEQVVLPAKVDIDGKLLLLFEPFLEIADEKVPEENNKSNEPIPLPQRAQ